MNTSNLFDKQCDVFTKNRIQHAFLKAFEKNAQVKFLPMGIHYFVALSWLY